MIITIATDIPAKKGRTCPQGKQPEICGYNGIFFPDPTFVVDSEGRVIAWNCAIEEMNGVKTSDIVGKTNYECSVAIYGKNRPLLVDLIFNDDPEVRNCTATSISMKCTLRRRHSGPGWNVRSGSYG